MSRSLCRIYRTKRCGAGSCRMIRGCRGDCDGKTYKVASLALAACIGSVLIDCCWDSGVEKNYRTLA
ncbi:hypothetical protein F2P81_011503 [Scophthalmus maximus]|uniref:Uncharacterized protein n=1 Tax=Scophthalmus maximus TaxID=52904 RepID=A0A6A4SYU5_SCOMX|nr:hypothetical protein F2P81_011503 [Scophthalmus maximus]